jgi:hypothetical protein
MEIDRLADSIEPERTVLLFGAGSSVPSGAPTGQDLSSVLMAQFHITDTGLSLPDLASLIEVRASRKELISAVRRVLGDIKPTGGLLNLPRYQWKSLFTTNFDTLIEQCYARAHRQLIVYASDFDFTVHDQLQATKLFKLHGTLTSDVSDGHRARLIIADGDYDHTGNFRETLYDRLRGDIVGSHLIIIGHSLQDPDIRTIANRCADFQAKGQAAIRISLLVFQPDNDRAQVLEKRGFSVCFGGIDAFLAALTRKIVKPAITVAATGPFDVAPELNPVTLDIEHAFRLSPDVSGMFNGRPATHADIANGLTFSRTVIDELLRHLETDESLCGLLLGASGVGKTTAARQCLQQSRGKGFVTWEHNSDHYLDVGAWIKVAGYLQLQGSKAVVLVDDAHAHLQEVNDLLEGLAGNEYKNLKLLLVSTRHHWNPRIKTPLIFKRGAQFVLARLDRREIENLLNLIETNAAIRALVEGTFAGFSRYERRRRLEDRCEAETFVCLKNIFASEKFDDIILREYAGLESKYQDIYRHVAALQSSGVSVHRQLIVRLLGIPATAIHGVLTNLTDIIYEYTVNEREGIYAWRGRHSVIVDIITRYKFSDMEKLTELLARVIDMISPTYEIEVRSIRELCNVESGVARIPDKNVQNRLLRKMMSVVPGERVPRHRLIRNLISMGEFEKAETEIRLFDKDFGSEGPVARYKSTLLTARAVRTEGILEEDRLSILDQARSQAEDAVSRYANNKSLLAAYCNVGVEVARRTGNYTVYDKAMAELREAEERLGDPDVGRIIGRFAAAVSAGPYRTTVQMASPEESLDELES